MPKVRFIIATLAVVMLLLLPTVALAQPDVCGFYGGITLDDNSVEDGTMLYASVDNEEVSSTVVEDSTYRINVMGDFAGKTVTFQMMIDGTMVGVKSVDWVAGDYRNVDIDAVTPPESSTGVPTVTLTPASGIATNVCGTGFHPNRTVTVKWEGITYATVKADASGEFCTPLVAMTDDEGSFTIVATDDQGLTDSADFTVTAAAGAKGDKGDTGDTGAPGAPGTPGEKGDKGDEGGGVLAIVALIIAVIAVILSVVFMMRGKQEAAA
jgi:hypothetical protein